MIRLASASALLTEDALLTAQISTFCPYKGEYERGTYVAVPRNCYLNPISEEKRELVDLTGAGWSDLAIWLECQLRANVAR